MKIVQVVHGFPPHGVGGTECHVKRITEGLRDRGHSLRVYAGSVEWRESFQAERIALDGYDLVRVHRSDLYFDRWDKAYNPLVEEHFRDLLRTFRPDLVHLHQWMRLTSNLCQVAAEEKVPAVATLHDLYTTCPRLFRLKPDASLCRDPVSLKHCAACLERWLFQGDEEIGLALEAFQVEMKGELRAASRLLAPSRSHAERLLAHGPWPDLEIEALPLGSGVDLRPAPRTNPGDPFRIVYFSHLYPFKGAEVSIRAFLEMERRPEAELHLFGAEVLPDFAERMKDLARGAAVHFHGPYRPEDLQSFPMDVIVFPTLAPESYSLILDEAAHLRVPLVASRIGALPERATESVALFEPGNFAELARILDSLIADPERLEAMRRAPPPAVLSLSEHLDRLERIYEEAVAEGPPAVQEGPAFRRLKEQWKRRELGLRELLRSERWEELVDSLKRRIAELGG